MTTRSESKATPAGGRMPVIFAAHGAPILLDDAGWMGELAAWAKALPKPSSVLMVSAHWEQRPTTLGATRTVSPSRAGGWTGHSRSARCSSDEPSLRWCCP